MQAVAIIGIVTVLLTALAVIIMRRFREHFYDADIPMTPQPPAKPALADQNSMQPDDIYTFSDTKCNTACCLTGNSSGMSCDRGCLCLSPEQLKLLQTRGYNNTPCKSI